MGLLLLLKRLLPGAAGDLFATPVQVKTHTTKTGVVVPAHTALRHKKLPETKPTPAPARDLFSVLAPPPAPKPTPKPAAPVRDLFSVLHDEPKPAPSPARPPAAPVAEDRTVDSAPVMPTVLEGFGVDAGTSKPERRRLNAAAIALLDAKSDGDMTDADRTVLAKYSGNGGCGDSLNEFYTPEPVAAAMWSLLARAGFKGGDVLEPSAGTGVFLHTAPAGTKVQAVELDPVSSRISRILHPAHASECASLERFATQDGRLFDAVIGNPPFGPRGALLADDKRDIGKAEHYFVDTALDKTKDGGLVVLIVPSSVMDASAGRSFREDIMRKAEFLGGSRMPNSAFESSHTDVTTDVLLFRKRPQEVAGALGWLSTGQARDLGAWDADFIAGDYFTEGRGVGNVHGSAGTVMRQFGPIYSVHGSMIGVPAAIEAMPIETPPVAPTMQDVLKLLGDDEESKRRVISAALKPPYQVAKPGDVRVVDGVRYILQGDPARWHRVEEELSPAIRDALRAADLLDDLTEGRTVSPAYARLQLQEALGAWVAAHGQPGRSKPLAAFLAQPSMPNTDGMGPEGHGARVATAARRAARLLGAVNPDGTYSDMVTGEKREISQLSLETLATTLSLKDGGFTVGTLAARAGRTEEDVLDYLHASPAYAVEVDGETWSTMDTYVAGELWPKLDAVRAAAVAPGAASDLVRKWGLQAAMLDAAIAPAVLEDVEITVGSGFITPADLNAWLADTDIGKTKATLTFDPARAIWEGANVGYGDAELVLRALNRKGVKKDERETLDRVNREFGDWIRQSDRREAVEDRYNRTHRGFRAKAYSDAPIAIPGMVTDGLKGFQYPGVRWALEAGSGIVAADVGLGKTVRGLMLARLMQTTGRADKPVIVVPKSVLANWLAEAEKWFPGSRVLTIGETYSTNKAGELVGKPDNEATRRAKYHQLQQNTFDFVLISQPAWNDLDINPVKKGELADNDFWAKRGDTLGNAGDKRLNDLRTRHEQALAQRDFADREHTIYFDDLGIDGLIMDEGHAYKNLYAAKNRFGETPKFLGGSGLSNRAQDTFFKTAVVREATGGKNVFMLTATPTKNSPLEVYSMLSHIAPEAFERMGIKNSEDFLDRFCEFTTDEILTVDGKIEDALVTSGFKNLDELREVMRRYIDRKTAEDVGLVIPQGDQVEHYIDMTPAQEAAYAGLREEVEASKKKDATGDSHIFSVMSRMGKAAIDLSLLGGGEGNSPKVDACVAEAVKNSADGGQVIFCDHIELHEKIAAKLVAAGVPRSAIGIINATAASSSAARQRICDQFNAGKITHVIGNTPCMGEGVNLQKGTTDIHHLDLPWEPASMQQRNGRGVRQGNTKEAVRLHSYLAKRSFDGYRLQTIKAKKDWQDLLWNGGDKVENLARENASMYDPVIMFAADPEAALAKRAADKDLAIQTKRAEQRGKAFDSFASYNKAMRAIAEMEGRGVKRETSDALKRLYGKVSTMRDRLGADEQFPHKHLLDTSAPVAIEPNTGVAWQPGTGLTLAGGDEGPVNYSPVPTRWVVSHVNPEAKTVTARPYGRIATTPITMDLERMKAGVTPFDASADEERAALAEDAKIKTGPKGAMKLHELRNLPPAALLEHGDAINRRMMDSILDYTDVKPGHGGSRPHYGVIGPDGVPAVMHSYSARSMSPDTHKLILPVPEHREKAIAAYVKEGLGRTIGTEYTAGHRGRQGESRSVAKYPSAGHSDHHNPWGGVLRDVFGRAAEDEAKSAVQAATVDAIGAAPTFRDAVTAAIPGIVFPPYGKLGEGAHDAWPKPVAAALRARAEALGVIDQRVHTAVGGNPSYGAGRIDEAVFKHKNERFMADGSGYGSRTVGEWMNAIGSKGAAE